MTTRLMMALREANDMKIVDSQQRKLEVSERDWILASDIVQSSIISQTEHEVVVNNIDDVAPELSVWGVPWKWI